MQISIEAFADACREILGDDLVGVYLHGSAAMGCFDPDRSDLDYIVVVEETPDDGTKRRLMDAVTALNASGPAKGIEMSVVKACFCDPFVYPTPFELHFSAAHIEWYANDPDDYIRRMNGTDKDLAAHFTIIGHYGICLFGKPVNEVFGEVSRADYLDSILCDVAEAREQIASDPIYIALNLCRVLAFEREGLILSKAGGGNWGLENLPPEHCGVISAALADYSGRGTVYPPETEMRAFADYMLRQLGA